jgi:hypothetical protein
MPEIASALRAAAEGTEKVAGYVGFAEDQTGTALSELGQGIGGIKVPVPQLNTKGMYDGVRDVLNAFHVPLPITPNDETIGLLNEIKLLTKPELTTTPLFGPVAQVIATGNAVRAEVFQQLSPGAKLNLCAAALRGIADGLDAV